MLENPDVDAVLHVGSHQRGEERENHLDQSADHTSCYVAQGIVGLPGGKCTSLTHVQLFIY